MPRQISQTNPASWQETGDRRQPGLPPQYLSMGPYRPSTDNNCAWQVRQAHKVVSRVKVALARLYRYMSYLYIFPTVPLVSLSVTPPCSLNRWTYGHEFWHGHWYWWQVVSFLYFEVKGQRSRSQKWENVSFWVISRHWGAIWFT